MMTMTNGALSELSSSITAIANYLLKSNAHWKFFDDNKIFLPSVTIGTYFLWLTFNVPLTIGLVFVLFILLSQMGLKSFKKRGEWTNVTGTEYRFLFGDLPALQTSEDGLYLMRLNASLGFPKVYRIWMGPQPTLVLANPDAVRQFWQQHDERIIEREVKLGWPVNMVMGEAIGLKSYRERNRISRFFHACFGPNGVTQFNADIEFETDKLINRVSELTARNDVIDIFSELKHLTLNSCAYFFLGPKWSEHRDTLYELNENVFDYMTLSFGGTWLNMPLVRWLMPKSLKLRWDIIKFQHDVDSLLRNLIEEYKAELNTTDILESDTERDSTLVRFVKMEAKGKSDVTYLELMHTTIEGLLFPSDASACTFLYTLVLLAWNNHVQIEARELVLNQLKQEGKLPSDTITLADLGSIDYLDWILNECQRLLPIFMYNVPEFTSQAMTICGVSVPKNTMTIYDVQSINRSDDIWDEPLVFRPERFQVLSDKQRKAAHAFGNGRSRRCLGEYLIKAMHKLLIARILLRFRIETLDDNRDIDQLPRRQKPLIFGPNIPLRFIPL